MPLVTRAVENEISEFGDILKKLNEASALAYAAAESEIKDKKDDSTIKRLEEIQSLMTGYSDLSEEVERFMRGTIKMKEKLSNGQKSEYSCQEIDEMFEEMQEEVGPVKSSSAQQEMLNKLESEMENLRASSGEGDQDFVVMQNIESYKDPFTKKMINDPVRSRTCNHYFERSSVTRYIKSGRQRCPYTGCNSHLHLKDLVDDHDLLLKLAQAKHS